MTEIAPAEHRETLGMPDVLERYPVPGPRSLDGILGFRLTEIGEDEARGEVEVTDRTRQRFGVVHGGVYAALAEMIASEATVHHVWPRGDTAMGQSNNTCFLRPCRSGTLHAHARARHRGRTSWVWDVDLLDDEGRLCASSRVTMAVRPRPD
jgi:1,4-dihydroxy-2-naphthoyl-CoA hydrolase